MMHPAEEERVVADLMQKGGWEGGRHCSRWPTPTTPGRRSQASWSVFYVGDSCGEINEIYADNR